MKAKDIILKGSRKLYRRLSGKNYWPENYILDRQKANGMIYELLTAKEACMISRFGSGEIGVVCNYLSVHGTESFFSKCINYITDNTGLPWWDELFFQSMQNNMGVFPKSIEVLEKFSERYLADTPEIDLLGCMNYTEKYMPLQSDVKRVHIESLYPFFVNNPWTRALKGKKVLVIHPFVHSIQNQHKHHEKVFKNSDVWPNYELITYRAIQSNAGAEVPYENWFEALKKMENDISIIEFDIAIIGCGAYGLPLAAHIKRMGRKAVHLGGGSQLLFGIKGRRWDNDAYHWPNLPTDYDTNYSALYNEYWCRPNEEETPHNANNVENACYW